MGRFSVRQQGAGALELIDEGAIALVAGELEAGAAGAVGELRARAERRRRARSTGGGGAVAEDDCFDERRPVQVVDMVERCAGGDRRAHDAVVAEVAAAISAVPSSAARTWRALARARAGR